MRNLTGSPILDLPEELQTGCFFGLGEVNGTLADALHMAITDKTLFAVYIKYRLRIHCYIVVCTYSSINRHLTIFRNL